MSGAVPGRAERVRRLGGHEGRWLVSLVWWVARRRIGVAAGDRPFGYAGAQAAIVYGLTFVCAVETVGLAVLLAGHPVAHAVMLVVDVYTVLAMLGLQAAAVTRPHVLGADALRIRDGARMEVRIPLERIAAVRCDLRFKKEEGAQELIELAVAGQTSVTVELSEPVVAVRLLGRRVVARTVRFHADDARGVVTAVRAAMGGPADGSPGRRPGAVTPG
ncbi:hypothetical protein FCH28_09200 [Streptomyces piniterrae]|uniref:Uncharacterized protein n=1 Tax=Streptomyces piniterrae TaxID=2571125 RepID=A0A4U0NML5_9ACTN|nr:hypothetical protein [Streptomyces piniterrae]TJZ55520.1 hypothetical protein FCH28_09200 [Streptomyces piniterrae]